MNYPHERWRLLITSPARGAWNMAVDEALQDLIAQDKSLPCLRLYAWEPPCLSIGYAQPRTDIDFTRLSARGWDWVRRPTGGRAILHTDELTYSVIASLSESRVTGGVLESYLHLSEPLLSALHRLDIPAQAHAISSSTEGQSTAAVCFEVPSNYEIVVGGKKLVGSAQARRKNVVLQHGTLPLWGDLERITQVLAYPSETLRAEAASRLLSHATTVESVLGNRITWTSAADSFITAFIAELNLELVEQELSSQELAAVDTLIEEKYANPIWLERL